MKSDRYMPGRLGLWMYSKYNIKKYQRHRWLCPITLSEIVKQGRQTTTQWCLLLDLICNSSSFSSTCSVLGSYCKKHVGNLSERLQFSITTPNWADKL
jgi:hypothetical protein